MSIFMPFALDFDSAQSLHTKYNRNAVYENDLVISGSAENLDPVTLGQSYTVTGNIVFEGSSTAPDTWSGISARMDEGAVGGTNRATDTSVSTGYALSWTPTTGDIGSHTLYVYVSNTNHQPPNNSDTYYDLEVMNIHSLTITGRVTYKDVDDTMRAANAVTVEVYEREFSAVPNYLIAEVLTSSEGYFTITADKNGQPISIADTGLLESGTRDLYLKVWAKNDAVSVFIDATGTWLDPLPFLDTVYNYESPVTSDISDDIVNSTFEYNMALTSTGITPSHAAVLGVPGYFKAVRDWFFGITEYARPLVNVLYPNSLFIIPTTWPGFNPLLHFIALPENWKAIAGESTIAHEYGHAIEHSIYGHVFPNPPDYPNYDGTGNSEHVEFSQTSEGTAVQEGWAEFLECAYYQDASKVSLVGIPSYIFDDPNKLFSWAQHANTDLETNSWWMGDDQNVDPAISRNPDVSLGNIVEGAMASILWDLWDGSNDDSVNSRWNDIWTVFYNDKPTSIWNSAGNNDFYHYWNGRFGETRAVDEVFLDHGIPVANFDDSYEENDSSGAAYALSNIQFTYPDLVLADAADWFKFTTVGTALAGSAVSLTFTNSRGNLNLYVYDSGMNLVGSSVMTGNTESVNLAGRAAGTYYVKVVGSGDNANTTSTYEGDFSPDYDLTLNVSVNQERLILMDLFRISDASGTPNTSNPGVATSTFSAGNTVRVTLSATNSGSSAIDVQASLKLRGPDNESNLDRWLYDSHRMNRDNNADSPLVPGETDFYSFDWVLPSSVPAGSFDVLGALRGNPDWTTVYDDTQAGANTTSAGTAAILADKFTVTQRTGFAFSVEGLLDQATWTTLISSGQDPIGQMLDAIATVNTVFNNGGLQDSYVFTLSHIVAPYTGSGDALSSTLTHAGYDFAVIWEGVNGRGYYDDTLGNIWWPGTDPFDATWDQGLVHEFGHARGAIDLYGLEVTSNLVVASQNYDYGTQNATQLPPQGSQWVMEDGWNATNWDSHSAHLMHWAGADNSRDTGDTYQTRFQEVPATTNFHVTGAGGINIPNATVKIYQRQHSTDLPPASLDATVDFTGTTNASGVFALAQNPMGTASNHQWTIFMDVVFNGQHAYYWRDITDFNRAFWNGNVASWTIDLATPFTIPPAVENVFVRSSSWLPSFPYYSGYSIPVGSGAQLLTLPWVNIDQIKVVFSENVTIDRADLALSGVNTSAYNISGGTFIYDPVTFTAIWTLPVAIGSDRLMLRLNADGSSPIQDTAGNRLDGEWTNPPSTVPPASVFPSGNGTAGGDFLFRFNVLLGDVNRDGYVKTDDVLAILPNLNKGVGDSGYTAFIDVDGNGQIKTSDVLAVLPKLNTSLPAAEPTAPPPFSATADSAAIASRLAAWDAALLDVAGASSGRQTRPAKKVRAIIQPLDETIEILAPMHLNRRLGGLA